MLYRIIWQYAARRQLARTVLLLGPAVTAVHTSSWLLTSTTHPTRQISRDLNFLTFEVVFGHGVMTTGCFISHERRHWS